MRAAKQCLEGKVPQSGRVELLLNYVAYGTRSRCVVLHQLVAALRRELGTNPPRISIDLGPSYRLANVQWSTKVTINRSNVAQEAMAVEG